ncbi:tetratricopeptide repeat protein [Saccharopolyspora sp. NFXS83]|uniref:ATP-binding protein n=1 Tax=Saccharopolyspora sp. NFXS83 TaxID=2993560 RepID=UPI00224AA6C3|nr:tetratricopeptide repeat protein [Saccharopolyspora sp. NFXS83]MCX2730363.1 tetratricopeptide repeat protein [Saccharopolyspora sp. NFXS83]
MATQDPRNGTGDGGEQGPPGVHNEVAANAASDLVVQAGTITGGVHQHVSAREVPVPRQLPRTPSTFIGRTAELATLSSALDEAVDRGDGAAGARVCAVTGSGGVGKTWLASRWAHQNLARFPDGQLHVDLRGFDPSGQPMSSEVAVRGFLDGLGVEPTAIPVDLEARAALYRSLVAGNRMLIVLDNAADTAQVAPLLPGSPTCAVLITSRRRLAGLGVNHGAWLLDLDVFREDDARALLADRLGSDRLVAESAAVAQLLRMCAGLPLALRVVAARAEYHSDFPLAVLAEELRDASARLDGLDAGDLRANLRAVLSWSEHALTPRATSMFGLLGTAVGPDIGLSAAASLVGVPVSRVRVVMRELEAASLVQQHAPGRYRMHDLVRLYAAERAVVDQTESSREAGTRRLVDHYLHSGFSGDRLIADHRRSIPLDPPAEGCSPVSMRDDLAAMEWFSAEHPHILAAQRAALAHGWLRHVWQFAWVLDSFHWRRGHLYDDIASWQAGLAAAERIGSLFPIGLAHRRLGRAHGRVNRFELALEHMMIGLELAEHAEDRLGQAHAHRIASWICANLDDDEKAVDHAKESLVLYRELGNPVWEAHALNQLGTSHLRLGAHAEAVDCCGRALALHREHRHVSGAAESLDSLGSIALSNRKYAAARDYYQDALALYRSLDNTYDEADVLEHLGEAFVNLDCLPEARQAWRGALRLYRFTHRAEEVARITDRLAGAG